MAKFCSKYVLPTILPPQWSSCNSVSTTEFPQSSCGMQDIKCPTLHSTTTFLQEGFGMRDVGCPNDFSKLPPPATFFVQLFASCAMVNQYFQNLLPATFAPQVFPLKFSTVWYSPVESISVVCSLQNWLITENLSMTLNDHGIDQSSLESSRFF